jgi:hypothetical protein
VGAAAGRKGRRRQVRTRSPAPSRTGLLPSTAHAPSRPRSSARPLAVLPILPAILQRLALQTPGRLGAASVWARDSVWGSPGALRSQLCARAMSTARVMRAAACRSPIE